MPRNGLASLGPGLIEFELISAGWTKRRPAPGLMAERALGMDQEGLPANQGHGVWAVESSLPLPTASCSDPGFGGFGLVHALEGSGVGILDGLGVHKGRDIKATCRADVAGIVQGHHQQAASWDDGV